MLVARRGDMIVSRRERGIVCSLDPPLMRTLPFTSYVLFDPSEAQVLQAQAEPDATAKPELIERVRRYVASRREELVAEPAAESS